MNDGRACSWKRAALEYFRVSNYRLGIRLESMVETTENTKIGLFSNSVEIRDKFDPNTSRTLSLYCFYLHEIFRISILK